MCGFCRRRRKKDVDDGRARGRRRPCNCCHCLCQNQSVRQTPDVRLDTVVKRDAWDGRSVRGGADGAFLSKVTPAYEVRHAKKGGLFGARGH